MKKIKLMLLFCIAAIITKSQPWSEKFYAHPNSFCCSGNTAGILLNNVPAFPGFLMAGFDPTGANGNFNFYIDRTKIGGSTGIFYNEYQVSGVANCATPTNSATLFSGVTVIETQNTGNGTPYYVMAGAFDQGCFFSSLSNTGVPITTKFFPFPAASVVVTKPLIVESTNNAYDYFIVGSYLLNSVQQMYVIKINLGGTVLQSKLYTCASPIGDLFPNGIVYSPYGNDLVVVGKLANIDFCCGPVEDRAFS